MKVEDYIQFYIGQSVKSLDGGTMKYVVTGLTKKDFREVLFQDENGHDAVLFNWKLLLRPLTNMKDEERSEDQRLHWSKENSEKSHHEVRALRTRYLLSRGFDLFGLIDAGLALDKTKS